MKSDNIINLSTLSDKRKVIKSSLDKVYKIISAEDIDNLYACEVWTRLNVLNEQIKDGKSADKDVLIDDIVQINKRLERLIYDFTNDKRRLKTLNIIYNNINDILCIDIMGFAKAEPDFNNDDIPF